MTSQELGNLFEKASFEILKELFQNWSFQITDSKIQKSGTQFGFDEFFKITFQNCSLNIYVECKASQDYNEIAAIELKDKIEQLEWSNFPKKDIHILFSPSKEIKFSNRETTIEDNKYPFVIMDWTRKSEPVNRNLVMELFVSYQGDNEHIKNYRDFLLREIEDSFKTTKTFSEVCNELKAEFIRRIDEHQAEAKDEEFRIINGTFWQRVQQNTDFERIHYFYTKIDSNDDRLRQVVANDFYVRNEDAISSFDIKFSQAIKQRKSLIKILAQGGEGKTTFLYHLAKTLCEENTVIWLIDISSKTFFTQLRNKITQIVTQKPLVFILDNPASFGEDLERFAEKLIDVFDKHNIVLITAERHFRYQEISERDNFEPLFDEVYDVNLLSKKITERIFGKLITAFQKSDDFSEELIEQSKAVFLQDKNLSIAERTYALIRFLTANNKLKGYTFDWQDWEEFAFKNAPKLKNLYLLLAIFYQFGNALNIEFCASFLELSEVEFPEINIFKEHKNLPIYRRGKNLFLRHEKLASWYLEDKMRLENSKHYFKRFLENINTEFTRDLFIWLCVKNKEFKNSEYAKLVDIDKRAEIFKNYIEKNPKELKSRTELSKIYQRQGKWKDAEDILLELLDLDKQNLQARTELSKIYQKQGKWTDAEDILLELLNLDENNLQARTELGKIYQKQGKWTDAERLLKEYIEIDPNGLHPRTELSKIYQQQKKWTDAERLLKEYIEIDPNGLHPRTELSKIYQKQGKLTDAKDILLEALKIDNQQLHPRTELSKIYQKQGKLTDAEDILLELLNLDENDLQARTELGKIYQKQGKLTDAERLLKEYIEIDPNGLHPRTELSKIHQKQGKWTDAEDILLELLDLDKENLQARTELSKIYQSQKKWQEAEKLLLECLKISEFDANALLELGKIYGKDRTRFEEVETIFKKILENNPFDIPAKMELAILYRNNYRRDEAELLYFEILREDDSNIFALYQMSGGFRRYKKYRVSIKLAEKILSIKEKDLLAILDLINIFTIINDKGKNNFYLEIGEKILEENKNHKHKDKFQNLRTDLNKSVNLIDFYKVGYCIKENGKRFIQSEDGEKFIVPENATFNYKINIDDKVFFGLYSKDGKTFADFIEPYFDNIDDLQKLK